MRKHIKILFILSAILILSGQTKIFAQCPPGTITLNSQTAVDDFIATYPNCTEIAGNLEIIGQGSNPIVDLTGLQNITHIGDKLIIQENEMLQNLNGLDALESITNDLHIIGNPMLANIDALSSLTSLRIVEIENCESLSSIGLNSLTSTRNLLLINLPQVTDLLGLESMTHTTAILEIDGLDAIVNLSGLENFVEAGQQPLGLWLSTVRIKNNDNLLSLEGLNNLAQIGGGLSIQNNLVLENLNGLENVNSIFYGILITDNPGLTSISGLSNVPEPFGHLAIRNNASLTTLDGLDNITEIGLDLSIKDNIVLADINALSNLQSIGGHIIIENNPALAYIDGLSNVQSVGLNIEIRDNNILTNIDGLSNIESVSGYITISNNNALTDITGLGSLESTNGALSIRNNVSLSSLDGLQNLKEVDESISIVDNILLQNLNGLSNLEYIGGLNIRGNDALTSLAGLQSLQTMESTFFNSPSLSIENNVNLTECAIASICEFLFDPNNTNFIIGNNQGCQNRDEILEDCNNSVGRIEYNVFYDQNENTLLDVGELFIPNISILIQPDDITVFSNSANGGFKYLNFNDYTVSYDGNAAPLWELTSGTSSFDVQLSPGNFVETVNFGFKPTQNISDLNAFLIDGNTRCNEYGTFEVITSNSGTTVANGVVWLTIDESITDVQFIDPPDFTEPLRYGWTFQDLFPGQAIKKQIKLKFPGPPPAGTEQILSFETEIIFTDVNGTDIMLDPVTYDLTLECAYDPNDKLVQPTYPENYALIGEDLIYTVRFQNTGNAEAYDVRIEDELDANLDLSTFRVITSSHEAVLSTYLTNNTATFEFTGIFLPDSTTNFDASQGYVMYSIKANEDIEDFTIIENTAEIYFDFNPAIITNTTENNMVTTFDADEDGFELWRDCDDNNATINADATEIANNMIDEDCDGEDLVSSTLTINDNEVAVFPNPFVDRLIIEQTNPLLLNYTLLDNMGRVVVTGIFNNDKNVLEVDHLPTGIYFLDLKHQESNTSAVQKIIKLK